MEHITEHLKVASTGELTNFLTQSNQISGLTHEEQKILKLKYQSKSFGYMQPAERLAACKNLLLKIHAITGWDLPRQELQLILIDQVEKKLTESFRNVNSEEMEYAFRNAPEVKEWGKCLNISLIDEVMLPYLKKRTELSRLELQEKERQEGYRLPAGELDFTQDWTDTRNLIKNKKLDYKYINPQFYDWTGKRTEMTLSEPEWKKYLDKTNGNVENAKRLRILHVMQHEIKNNP